MKTFTPDALDQGHKIAGGVTGKQRRFEVLYRLARIRACLPAGQKSEWQWFKEAWDGAMVDGYKDNWGSTFAIWMQRVVDDDRSNAFSVFVYNETARVFHGTMALHVPGC